MKEKRLSYPGFEPTTPKYTANSQCWHLRGFNSRPDDTFFFFLFVIFSVFFLILLGIDACLRGMIVLGCNTQTEKPVSYTHLTLPTKA